MSRAIGEIALGVGLIVGTLLLGPAAIFAYAGVELFSSVTLATGLLAMGASLIMGGISAALTANLGTGVATKQAASARTYVYGRSRIGGTIMYESWTGNNNQMYNMIIAHAAHQVSSIQALYLDGRLVNMNSSDTVHDDGDTHYDAEGNQYNFGGLVRWETRPGNPGQSWMSSLNNVDPNWKSTSTVQGAAYSYLQLSYSSTVFPNGAPGVRVDVVGKCNIYDPRSGTYGYSENPALCIADMLCDTTGFGLQCNFATEIDEAQLIAAANACDEPVFCQATNAYEPRYSLNGAFTSDLAPGDILQQMLLSCAGRMTYVGGVWQIFPGVWTGPSFSFGDSDLTGPIRWQAKRKYRDLTNGVRGTFVTPTFPYLSAGPGLPLNQKQTGIFDGQWRPCDFPAFMCDTTHGYAADAYYAADGNTRLWQDIRLPFVISAAGAQRLAKIALMRNRQQGSGTFQFSLAAYQAKTLDVINFSHPRWGWSNKMLEITNTRFTFTNAERARGEGEEDKPPSIGLELDLVETDPSVYAWNPATEELPLEDNPIIGALGGNNQNVGAPGIFTLESDSSTTITSADGIVRSRIKVSWTESDDRVSNGGLFVIEWRVSGTTNWFPAQTISGSNRSMYIDNVSDNTSYDVRIAAQSVTGAYSAWVQGTVVSTTTSSALTTVTINNSVLV